MKSQEEVIKIFNKRILSSTWWTSKVVLVVVKEDKDSRSVSSQNKNKRKDSRFKEDHLLIQIIKTTNLSVQFIIQTLAQQSKETTKVLWAQGKIKTPVTLSKSIRILQICKKFIIKQLLLVSIRILINQTPRSGLIKVLPANLNRMRLFTMRHMNSTPRRTMFSLEAMQKQLLKMEVDIKGEVISWVEEMIRLILKLWVICSADTIMKQNRKTSISSNKYTVTWNDFKHQKVPGWTSTRRKTTSDKRRSSKIPLMIWMGQVVWRKASPKTKAKVDF